MKKADAQNLLANGGFEDLNTCYEYKATCSPAAWFTVMPRILNIPPKEGKHVLTFCFDNLYTPLLRTFPYTKLLCSLKAGNEYTMQLWTNTSKYEFSHFDVLFTNEDPSRITNSSGSFEPTFQFSRSDIVQKDSAGWMLLRKQFTPQQDYNFMLLGNLANNTVYAKLKKHTLESSGNIICEVDDISLRAKDSSLNSCPRYEDNLKQLYAETRRHTRFVYLDERKAPLMREISHTPEPSGRQAKVLKSDTLIIPGILFKTNSSAINADYKALLDEVMLKIKDKDISAMNINGYTDNTGTIEFNKSLSLKRAICVGAYLTDRLPKYKAIITSNGYGAAHPVAPNNNEVNKAKNRRVEIILNYFYLSE